MLRDELAPEHAARAAEHAHAEELDRRLVAAAPDAEQLRAALGAARAARGAKFRANTVGPALDLDLDPDLNPDQSSRARGLAQGVAQGRVHRDVYHYVASF